MPDIIKKCYYRKVYCSHGQLFKKKLLVNSTQTTLEEILFPEKVWIQRLVSWVEIQEVFNEWYYKKVAVIHAPYSVQNGGDFNILLSTFKLAPLASFLSLTFKRIFYEARRAHLNVDKRRLNSQYFGSMDNF